MNVFLHRNSTKAHQELLLDLTWAIWPELPAYGRKAAQFVDLLGYFSLKTPQTEKKVGFTIAYTYRCSSFYNTRSNDDILTAKTYFYSFYVEISCS